MSNIDDIKKKAELLTNSNIGDFDILVFMINKIHEHDSKNDIILKGGTALMDRVLAVKPEMYRMTEDIDLHIKTEEAYNKIFSNIENILNDNNLGLIFKVTGHRERSGTGERFKLEVTKPDGTVFKAKIDMQVGVSYQVDTEFGVRVKSLTYSNYSMLADKISVISSDRLYRRSKDLYDLYILTRLYDYDMEKLIRIIMLKRHELITSYTDMFTPENLPAIEQAYSKFRNVLEKPDFCVIYKHVTAFIYPIYKRFEGDTTYKTWNKELMKWI